uniref:Uncharacterized protein n=1 Tax=Arundo donax TaxID=35708 RepID=A0A0A9G1D7_ARUDO
MTISSSWMLR